MRQIGHRPAARGRLAGWLMGGILMCALTNRGAAQDPNPSPPNVATLRRTLKVEVALAQDQGYVPHATEHLLRRAEELARRAGRARRSGQPKEGVEAAEKAARPAFLWAKGSLLDLKLPTWARDARYYYPKDASKTDPDRGVVFGDQGGWTLAGDFPGQWGRGHYRPYPAGPDEIDALRRQGKRVGTYLSGGMLPITYALLPQTDEEWCTDFMRRYAGSYWHYGERWWGATGDKKTFRDWMLPHLDFAHQAGLDYIHLDEAWGGYPEARPMNDRSPGYVIVTNNFGMTYVDQESFRFGWTAMGEAAGSPHDWDNFAKALRARALAAHNLVTWSWLWYELQEAEFYHNLAYATTTAHKTANVALVDPSRSHVAFAHRYRDYLLSPAADIGVPQEGVKLTSGGPSARACLTRRFLRSGAQEWIVHILNTDPKVEQTGPVTVAVAPGEARLPGSLVATFASPEQPAVEVPVARQGGALTLTVPGVRIWGVVVIGQRLFPRVSLRLAARGGAAPQPLDNTVVPGETFEVEAEVERLAPVEDGCSLELVLPAAWQSREIASGAAGRRRFAITVLAGAPCDRGYAITPVATRGREGMPGFPLQVEAKPYLTFRLFPPCVDLPARRPARRELEVKNNSAAGRASVSLTAPEGWAAQPADLAAELGPGEAKRFPLDLSAPNLGVSFWYHKDAQLGLKWRLGEHSGSESLRVRVFPATFAVYHQGVEKLILHGYPNLYFRDGGFEGAERALDAGEYAALWLANQDPAEWAPRIERFLAKGGGVVWMGAPFPGAGCPVTLEAEGARPKGMVLLAGGEPPLHLAAPVLRFRNYYESADGFRAWKVKAKEWARATANWSPQVKDTAISTDGSPAVVVSTDPKRRIAYIASDLEATTEGSYHFEERVHRQAHWYLTYYYYHLLAWAAGTEDR